MVVIGNIFNYFFVFMSHSVFNLLLKIGVFRKIFNYFKSLKSVQKEILKGMIFNNTISDSEWLKYKSFSPGAWAADYGLLYTLYRVLNGMKPQKVLEFGLGQSSKMIHQYGNYYNISTLTYEHDDNWISFFKNEVEGKYKVNITRKDICTVKYKNFETLTYNHCLEGIENEKFDMILVDGPFGRPHYSRPQIIDIIKDNLADSFCIIIDDTDRPGELETATEVRDVLAKKGINSLFHTYSSSKKHTLICSEDLKFLTSL